ncbi:hypothetical protein AAC387_Pa05g0851 [Persea americana]
MAVIFIFAGASIIFVFAICHRREPDEIGGFSAVRHLEAHVRSDEMDRARNKTSVYLFERTYGYINIRWKLDK